MVALTILFAAAALLSRGVISRLSAERGAAQREAALRDAESALELARAALEAGKLAPGGTYKAGGLSVVSAATPNGARLEALAEIADGKRSQVGQPALRPRRAVRVVWELDKPAQGGWRLKSWSARNETLTR